MRRPARSPRRASLPPRRSPGAAPPPARSATRAAGSPTRRPRRSSCTASTWSTRAALRARPAGFGADDAAFLRATASTRVRLGLIYRPSSPHPALRRRLHRRSIATTEQMLAEHGHLLACSTSTRTSTTSASRARAGPTGRSRTTALPAEPQVGFPGNYLGDAGAATAPSTTSGPTTPARAASASRTATPPPGAHVAARFAARTTCSATTCSTSPGRARLADLHQPGRLPAVRRQRCTDVRRSGRSPRSAQVDPRKLVFYEPLVTFDFGADTTSATPATRTAGFSFHDYCLPGGRRRARPASCERSRTLPFQNADEPSRGDRRRPAPHRVRRHRRPRRRSGGSSTLADATWSRWQYWHYCGCDDPTTQGPAPRRWSSTRQAAGRRQRQAGEARRSSPGPIPRPSRAPRRATASTRATRVSASPTRPPAPTAAARFGPGAETEIFVPQLHYPDGYDVDVDGAGIASPAGAQLLRLVSCPGASEVSVAVSPAGAGSGNGPDCNAGSTGVAGAKDAIRGCAVKRFKAKNRHAKRKRRLRAAGC